MKLYRVRYWRNETDANRNGYVAVMAVELDDAKRIANGLKRWSHIRSVAIENAHPDFTYPFD